MLPRVRVSFRKLWPGEGDRLERHLLRLRSDDRLMRFGGPVSDEVIRRYCGQTEWLWSIVLGGFIDGTLRAAGELKLLDQQWPPSAEIAITVEGDYQDRGIGTEILSHLIVLARNRFVATVHMICLNENRRMQRVARKFGTTLVFADGQAEGRIVPAVPDFLSLFGEAAMETVALLRPGASTFGIAAADPPTPEKTCA